LFSVKHLWIDALCIIQDFLEDWIYESEHMESVYSHIYITIAAAWAAKPDEGLFKERNEELNDPEGRFWCTKYSIDNFILYTPSECWMS